MTQRALGKRPFDISLRQLLIDSVEKTKPMGSSTFVMARIDDEFPFLQSLNLGDSGIMILRAHPDSQSLEVKYRSKEQQYGFDFPYQCGTNCEPPVEAEYIQHNVSHNDIVILASDGLFDNLFDQNIVDCVREYFKD